MSFKIVKGDLFATTANCIGHGVNTQGVMGAGVAAVVRNLYPNVYRHYRAACVTGRLKGGDFQVVQAGYVNIFNLASQTEPGADASIHFVRKSVSHAMTYMEHVGLYRLAIPQIGCGIGGLDWVDVRPELEWICDRIPNVHLEVHVL